MIFNILQKGNKMIPFELRPFNLKENSVESGEGMRTCQDYESAINAPIYDYYQYQYYQQYFYG